MSGLPDMYAQPDIRFMPSLYYMVYPWLADISGVTLLLGFHFKPLLHITKSFFQFVHSLPVVICNMRYILNVGKHIFRDDRDTRFGILK